jgi:capsular polysaccharide transport system permease protein
MAKSMPETNVTPLQKPSVAAAAAPTVPPVETEKTTETPIPGPAARDPAARKQRLKEKRAAERARLQKARAARGLRPVPDPTPDQASPPATPSAAPAAPTLPKPDRDTFAAGPVAVPTATQRRLFSRITVLSFVLCVILPILASAAYFAFLAVDRYAVEIKFAIRSPSGTTSSDLLGLVSGTANSNSTVADSWMVVEYLESREFLEALSRQVDLKDLYAAPRGDILTQLPVDATTEDMVDFLPSVVSASFESATQIITVETQAFTPDGATRMAQVVLEASSTLINAVSEKARQDTVRLAEQEVIRAEEALRAQRTAIATFRETEQKIDPTASVATQEGVLAQLQNRLASTRTELSSLREFLAPEAPSVRVLQSQIDSLERQIDAERARLGIGNGEAKATPGTGTSVTDSLNRSVTLYEALKVDLDFRERAYLSALSSLEAARIEADRQQRYVATFVTPSQPQSARYPQVTLSMILIGTVAFLIWGVLAMFLHILREHLT